MTTDDVTRGKQHTPAPSFTRTVHRAALDLTEVERGPEPPAGPVTFMTSVPDAGLSDWESGVWWKVPNCSATATRYFNECEANPAWQNPTENQSDFGLKCIQEGGSIGTAVPFDLYWAEETTERCNEAPTGDEIRQRLIDNSPCQFAQHLHESLQECATDLSLNGEGVTTCLCIEEAMGLLWAARGTFGTGGGTFVVPDFLVPALVMARIIKLTADGRGYVTDMGWPVVVGPGIPTGGPGGAVVTPGTAYLYITGPVDRMVSEPELMNTIRSFDSEARINRTFELWEGRGLVRVDDCNTFAVCVALPGSCCVPTAEGEG